MPSDQLDFRQPEFWEERYRAGQTGWDLGQPAPPLVSFVRQYGHQLPKGRAVVLGCGRGHDALFLAENGWEVLGVDVSELAVQQAQAQAQARGLSQAQFLQADLFRLPPELKGRFDLAVEHTCFCAIDPERRDEYVRVVAALVRPGGAFLGLFFTSLPPGGPPFPASPEEIETRFAPYFQRQLSYVPEDSHPQRQGREWLVLFRRNAAPASWKATEGEGDPR